jgi:hypothetical protein
MQLGRRQRNGETTLFVTAVLNRLSDVLQDRAKATSSPIS